MTPVGEFPAGITEWDTRRCSDCERRRVHAHVAGKGWVCIGALSGRRYSKKCKAKEVV